MLKKIIFKIIYLGFVAYLIYLLYYKGVSRFEFILGNVVLALLVLFQLIGIYFRMTTKTDKDYQLINEVLDEIEAEKKAKINKK